MVNWLLPFAKICINATHSFNSAANSALLLIDKGSTGVLQENCQTGMRLCLPLTRRPKMTCVRDNEWWVGKAWSVGILTIWVTCVLLFAASSAHEFWKLRCKLFLFQNICRQRIGKKMIDGWTKAMGWPLGISTIGIHLFNTLCRLCSVHWTMCTSALQCLQTIVAFILSEYISWRGFNGKCSYFPPFSLILLCYWKTPYGVMRCFAYNRTHIVYGSLNIGLKVFESFWRSAVRLLDQFCSVFFCF